MTSVFYVGLEPSATQVVQESLSRRGIRLLKTQPSQVIPVVGLSHVQPGHAIFKTSLPVYVKAALSRDSTPLNEPWCPLEKSFLPGFVRNPAIIWSYSDRVSPDFINKTRSTYRAQETVAKGKAWVHRPSGQACGRLYVC
jgi:hypothetical protein